MRILESFIVTFVFLLLLAFCQNTEVKNNFHKEYRQIKEKFVHKHVVRAKIMPFMPKTCRSCREVLTTTS
jgi:hypothetical protein